MQLNLGGLFQQCGRVVSSSKCLDCLEVIGGSSYNVAAACQIKLGNQQEQNEQRCTVVFL